LDLATADTTGRIKAVSLNECGVFEDLAVLRLGPGQGQLIANKNILGESGRGCREGKGGQGARKRVSIVFLLRCLKNSSV